MTYKHLAVSLTFLINLSCRSGPKDKRQPLTPPAADTTNSQILSDSASNKIQTTITHPDTSLFPFSDSTFRMTIHRFGPDESYDEDEINTTITFSQVRKDSTIRFFSDSVHCMSQLFDSTDMNNDRINDVLIFHSTGARANPTYHLYLKDTMRHRLIYVKKFEELPNPNLDSANNIITSVALSGVNYYKFYRINRKNRLIDLGHGFSDDGTDSIKYDRAIKAINRDRKKKE